MTGLHDLLRQQALRHFGNEDAIPEEWREFLRTVSETYVRFDQELARTSPTSLAALAPPAESGSGHTTFEERSRLKFIFDALPIGICLNITRADGTTSRVINDAHFRIAGITREQDKPETWRRITHPEDRERQAKLFRELEQKGSGQFSCDKRYVHQDGRIVWVMFSLERRRRPDGGFEDLSSVVDITQRKAAEEELRQLHEQHELILNSIGEGVFSIDSRGCLTFNNPAARALFGKQAGEWIGRPAHRTFNHTRADGTPRPEQDCPFLKTLVDGRIHHASNDFFWRKDGSGFPVDYVSTPVHDSRGKIIGATVVFADISERKRIQAQLVQSQKMETVGRLAGGIAHEFNSIMTAIIGHSELLLQDLPVGDSLCFSVSEIRRAAERAATLTRQLLAYGRRQILRMEVLDLNDVLRGMENTLCHLGGTNVQLSLRYDPGLDRVRADVGQMEQVIINMAMNAVEAMPAGGKLDLTTSNVLISEDSAEEGELRAGSYVTLSIADTGRGMSDELKQRIFEPFFTTKGIGQGPGLGLATCYGIIKQLGGHIAVTSKPGCGSTFTIYLPKVVDSVAKKVPAGVEGLVRGTEAILLVEDDPMLRDVTVTVLKRLGYDVLAAADGIEALKLVENHTGKIDLLLTDILMPQIDGRDLADRVRRICPNTKVLFISAFPEHSNGNFDPSQLTAPLLHKPFPPAALARMVRQVLDCG